METLIAIKTYSLDGPSCPLKEFKQYYRDILLFCNVVEIEKSVDRPWCRFRDVFALRAGDQVLPAAQDELLTLGRLLLRADEVVDDRLDGAGLERGVVRSQAVESLQLVVEEGSHRGERFKRTRESCCFFVFDLKNIFDNEAHLSSIIASVAYAIKVQLSQQFDHSPA